MTLLPSCVLPGCVEFVEDVGEPCARCKDELGPFLAHVGGPRLTPEQIEERDRAMVQAQRVANGEIR